MAKRRCLMAITGALHLGGGIATANRLALHAFLESGYDVEVIALNEGSDVTSDLGTKIAYRGLANSKTAFAWAVWHSILRHRPSVIFCDHVNLALVLAPLRWLPSLGYIVRLNGIEVFPGELNWEGKLGLKAARKRTAISDHTRQQVLLQYPGLDVQTCDLSLDPDSSRMEPQPPANEKTEITLKAVDGSDQPLKHHVLLHVGRMASSEQYKGQDTLIRSMPQVLAAIPDAQLVLVGRGDDADRLLNLAQQQPAHEQSAIFMTGFVSDELLQKLYKACYLFAMPSRGEGFGLVYLEAMRWAKPCIGSRVDSARCIVQDGRTGILINDPTDVNEVAAQLVKILSQPELAHEMGIAGFQLLRERFLFPHFKQRFIDFIQ